MLVTVPLAIALAGCTTAVPVSHAPAARASRPPVVRTRGAPGTSHGASPGAGSPDVTLAFAGDVNFARRTARLLRHPAAAFGPISSVLGAADLTMVNLETAVTSRGRPQPKQFHFLTTGKAFTAIRAAGIDLVTMANNH